MSTTETSPLLLTDTTAADNKPSQTDSQFQNIISDHGWNGLTKEEVLQSENDPFWRRLRWLMILGCAVALAGMVLGAVASAVYTYRSCVHNDSLHYYNP